jgi:hypothetical protein
VFVNVLTIMQARVNIPALSARTIERDIAASSFTIKAGVQVQVLCDHITCQYLS